KVHDSSDGGSDTRLEDGSAGGKDRRVVWMGGEPSGLDDWATVVLSFGYLPIGNQCMSALPSRAELLPGTLAMLVLKTLTVSSMHGYAIAQHIERLSDDVLRVQEGTLYPALQMMEVKGWVRSEWKLTPTKRRARYYAITATGRKQLAQEAQEFDRVVAA